VVSGVANNINSKADDRMPKEWVAFKSAVGNLDVADEFARSTKRFRLMLSSAMSIFVFTFQGNMEAALSTFDCKDGFLRNTPTVMCDTNDPMFVHMVVISAFGIIIYSSHIANRSVFSVEVALVS